MSATTKPSWSRWPGERTTRWGAKNSALADRGYFNGEQVLACEGTGIALRSKTVWPHERGLFTRHDFIYDAENDHYTCPAGQKLTKGLVRSDRRDDVDHYRHLTACFTCSLRPKCTPDKLKRLKRWRHEHVLDKMQTRLDNARRYGHPSANRRASVRNPQVDGKHPLPDENPWKGPDADEPPRSDLQHEEDDPNPRRRAANGGDYNLTGLGNRSPSAFSAHRCDVHQHSSFYTASTLSGSSRRPSFDRKAT